MAEKTIEIERIAHVRDIFVLCCYTGLAYINVKQIKRTELLKGIDDKKWRKAKRQKTESPRVCSFLKRHL